MVTIVYSLLGLSLMLCFIRLVRGPSVVDRVAALDLMAVIFSAVTAVYAVFANQPIYYDIVLVLSIFAFFGTVAVGRFLEREVVQ